MLGYRFNSYYLHYKKGYTMKNWKLNLTNTEVTIFRNRLTLTEEQKEYLKSLGFEYRELFNSYHKYISNFTEMALDLNKGRMYFYSGRYMLPCEITNTAVLEKSKLIAKDLHKHNIIK